MESKKMASSILYGVAVIYGVAAIFSLVFSLLLRFTSLDESSLTYIITSISFIALFIGGFISGGRGKEKGWLLGGLTGIIYTIINFLFQYLGMDALFTLEQIIYYICFIVIAMMGGILGVNIVGNRTRQS
ncbi:TIGR04086 family membrane protein [Bacillus kwashiorkori]|uniref:TIGR04086 family membrane protein n=1 Tax=Bacillus kwashiorkori TaxID=1522318 RepID=UPI0007817977|nr:TIGR04086 family membrane protein [Bacillus kwashiorkori]